MKIEHILTFTDSRHVNVMYGDFRERLERLKDLATLLGFTAIDEDTWPFDPGDP